MLQWLLIKDQWLCPSDVMDTHLESPRHTWSHLVIPGVTLSHLESPRHTWSHLVIPAYSSTWRRRWILPSTSPCLPSLADRPLPVSLSLSSHGTAPTSTRHRASRSTRRHLAFNAIRIFSVQDYKLTSKNHLHTKFARKSPCTNSNVDV